MTVTAETPWRETGDTTVAGLVAEFRTQGDSPLINEAARLLAAAGGMSRLMAGISFVEQKHATYQGEIPKASHNFLSLASGWKDGGHTWAAFTSYAACVARWKQLLTDPAGAYRNAKTVRELINIYAPPVENDVDRYVRQALAVINRLPLAGAGSETVIAVPASSATITFGRVEAPDIVHRDISTSVNTAFSDLGQRLALFVVLHRMYGPLAGTYDYFIGDARTRARTDYGVDAATGEIWRFTDPLSTVSPWASGPYSRPSGDAPALVRALGQAAINRDGISVEISLGGDDPVSAVSWAKIARLIAFWADWNGISHEQWPINPKTGLTFLYWHREFNGGKGPDPAERDAGEPWCPGEVVEMYTTQLIEDVRVILKAAQTGGRESAASTPTRPSRPETPATTGEASGPVSTGPRPTRPPSALVLPAGVSIDDLEGMFGQVTYNGDVAMTFTFDPTGPVTALWLAHGKETGEWPQLAAVQKGSGGLLFRFDGGYTILAPPRAAPKEVAA